MQKQLVFEAMFEISFLTAVASRVKYGPMLHVSPYCLYMTRDAAGHHELHEKDRSTVRRDI
jgi:hypothetical protein